MLFTSYEFIFGFLIPVAAVAAVIARFRRQGLVKAWLIAASIAFYAYSQQWLIVILVGSIAFNFAAGRMIASRPEGAHIVFPLAVAANLALLGYLKYLPFIIENTPAILHVGILPVIAFPVGISFFTLQQVAYLIDARNGRSERYALPDYALFVGFFAQVTAGPINSHRDSIPQYRRSLRHGFRTVDLAVGLSMFAIGLFKKALVAQALDQYVAPAFTGPAGSVSFLDAWSAAIAFTLEVYFDFSGYSDMALGIARLFGIRLPINFNSPYKATSPVDFWKRWHMSMTRFFTDYVYSPLALTLTRRSMMRRYSKPVVFVVSAGIPTIVSFLIIGLWHGANWTFVVFGVIHGVALTVNQAWNRMKLPTPPTVVCWGLTMGLFTLTCVLFRANSLAQAAVLLKVMCGLTASSPSDLVAQLLAGWHNLASQLTWMSPVRGWTGVHVVGKERLLVFLTMIAFCVALPNTAQLMRLYRPVLGIAPRLLARTPRWMPLVWRPNLAWSIVIAGLITLGLMNLSGISEFIYFRF